nr:MAG TPA: hypothetical protein [Caudoviricetes sp.]
MQRKTPVQDWGKCLSNFYLVRLLWHSLPSRDILLDSSRMQS